MASFPVSESPSPPHASSEDADNNLQPFFVLHRASAQKPDIKTSGSRKTRRKIELPSPSSKPTAQSDADAYDNEHLEMLRLQAFCVTWSKIESTIKDVLRKINVNLYNEVHQWVKESFLKIKSSRSITSAEVQWPVPLVTDTICKQIPTALILTKNVEFIDDLLTFRELGDHLRSNGCHVASLSASDFLLKHGISGCLGSLLRHLVTGARDVADIAVLASWYCEPSNYDHPVVVIIDDVEQCEGSMLSDFITMLSEWVVKIPIVFIMGVATSIDAPRRLLKSDALQHLQPCKFTVGSPYERMNAVTEAVLVKSCFGFNIGHKVAVLLRDYFLRHDGTITSFIRALKLACMKHFSVEPLSFLGEGMLYEDCETFWRGKCEMLPDFVLRQAFDLPSCRRGDVLEGNGDNLAKGLLELKRLQKGWSSAVLFLFEVGKLNNWQLLDIFCEALNPTALTPLDHMPPIPLLTRNNLHEGSLTFAKGGFIAQAISKASCDHAQLHDSVQHLKPWELPLTSICHLLSNLSIRTEETIEIHQQMNEIQSIIASADGSKSLKENLMDLHNSKSANMGKTTLLVNDKIVLQLESVIRRLLMPIESIPFHEIVCFKDANILQTALNGDPRRIIQVDLLKSHCCLQCSCCSRVKNALSPSMHDTSILHSLAQKYGDLVNLHDWYQSFRATILSSSAKSTRKAHSPASKKVKAISQQSEAMIQARFCRAVTELQITGFLRMPTKRRPDFVQRVAFGL